MFFQIRYHMAQAIAALTGGWGEDNDVKVAVNEGDSRYLFLDHKINLQMEYEIVFFSHQLLPLILLSLMAIYFNLWWGLRDVCDAVFASIYILSWEAKVCVRMNEWENGKSIRRRSLLAFGLSLSRPFSRNDWGCCWSVWSSWLCEEGQQCSILLQ